MNEEKKLYTPIADDTGQTFPLKKTSHGNIRALALICSQRISDTDANRAQWAEQAGIEPAGWIEVRTDAKTKKQEKYLTAEEKKSAVITVAHKPIYQVQDVYSEFYFHAALAPVLFDGFPTILEVSWPEGEEGAPKIVVKNEQLFDDLLEEVVNAAFLEFAGKRNPTSRLLSEYLNHSGGDLGNLLNLARS